MTFRRILPDLRVMIAFAGVFGAAVTDAQWSPHGASSKCRRDHIADSARVDGYVFTAFENGEDMACLEISRDGQPIFRETDVATHYGLGQKADSGLGIPSITNGTDVTGRGNPDMIVSLYTGGAHCCTTHYLFELRPEIKLLAKLNDAHDDMAHFAKAGHGYVYVTADWTFAYWPDCFACSPSELVTLKFVDDKQGGGFHLDLEAMRKPEPTAAEWKKELQTARASLNDGAPINQVGRTLWEPVLDLIYSGHSDLAWKFVDDAGPNAQKPPLPDLQAFCTLLKSSEYWPDLEPTLRDTPPACANAKPGRK